MRCENCGAEVDLNGKCPNCHTENNEIKVLSPEEKHDFRGITIDQTGQRTAEESRDYQDARQRIYVRQVNFSSVKTGFFLKLLIGAGLIVLAMVAFSTLAFFAVVSCIVWFVLRLLR